MKVVYQTPSGLAQGVADFNMQFIYQFLLESTPFFFKPVENLILSKNLEEFSRKSCGKPEESSKKVHPSPRLSSKIIPTLIMRQYIHKYSVVESCKWISMVVMSISSNLQYIYATLERL